MDVTCEWVHSDQRVFRLTWLPVSDVTLELGKVAQTQLPTQRKKMASRLFLLGLVAAVVADGRGVADPAAALVVPRPRAVPRAGGMGRLPLRLRDRVHGADRGSSGPADRDGGAGRQCYARRHTTISATATHGDRYIAASTPTTGNTGGNGIATVAATTTNGLR